VDFSYDEEHEAVRQLADRIFAERATHERMKELELDPGDDGPFDRALWGELAAAGLVGIALPEDVGGAGLDFVALSLVLEAAGRTAAYVPVVETMVHGALTIDRFGTPEQRQAWLPATARGDAVLTAALAELVGDVVVRGTGSPATVATRVSPGTWRLEGTKACVPAGMSADLVLVPASLVGTDNEPAGEAVFLLPTGADGVTRRRMDAASRPEALIELSGVVLGDDAILGGTSADASAILSSMTEHGAAALAVVEAGACAATIALISEFTKTREQFGKPIATFQAVGQRAADAYVDAEAVRLSAWEAAWRLSEGLAAAAEVATAKFWAADGGQRVVHAAAHLHGGVSVDRDYPLHRYFLLTEQIELTLGGATENLLALGRLLADEPV